MKKNNAKNYARALYEVSQSAPDNAELVPTFVALLRRKNALAQLPKILAEFEKYSAKKEGAVFLSLSSANPLSTDTKKQINTIFGGQTAVTETIDPSLIGGVVIRSEDTIFDASLKTQLERLKNTLMI